MMHTVPSLPLPDFAHERVEVITGRRSGLFIAVALHSSVLGSALGGARLWTYPHWSDALGDALRLSAAMTLKNAAAGLDAGGGKSVIALPPGTTLDADRRRAAFLDLGDAVESLHGLYRTAEDVGSTTDDMLVVSERTEHVVGLPDTVGGSGEPAGPTSLGVYESLRATLERVAGTADVAGRRVTISGLGQVGSRLAVRLSAEGARLTVTDVNPAKRDLAAELGADWVSPGEEHLVPADVFVPAGIGGLLTDEVIDALDAKAVCGPANNPLADHSGADATRRSRHPVRPRLRGERRWRDLPRPRGEAARHPCRDHGAGRADRRHRAPDLRRGRVAGYDPARSGGGSRGRAAGRRRTPARARRLRAAADARPPCAAAGVAYRAPPPTPPPRTADTGDTAFHGSRNRVPESAVGVA